MTTVQLHVGTFKTGTSYLQSVLANSKGELEEVGVLWPGRAWADQVAATKGLMTNRPGKSAAWDRLVDEINQWGGSSAIVSMETLSMASPRAVKRAAASLSGHHVKVILTARDIGRVLPAQWQESVQNGKTWAYRDYLESVVTGRPGDRAYDHFWSKHDWARVLKTWSGVAPDAELILVTVPPSGSPRGLLWQRFCAAVDLKPEEFDSSQSVNESLGAASAEVIRYVSAALDERETHQKTGRVVKKTLAKAVLNGRKSEEPTLVLPHDLEPWAESRSRELVAGVQQIPTKTIGDLGDLYPQFLPAQPNETEDPAQLPATELMAAAGFGLAAMCDLFASNGLAPRGYGPDDSSPRRGSQRRSRQ